MNTNKKKNEKMYGREKKENDAYIKVYKPMKQALIEI